MQKLEMGELVLMAARRGDLKQVELLLQNGADINCCDQYGLTALHASAIKGHKDIALMLIEFGLELECRDSEGHAPLHLAVVGGSLGPLRCWFRMGLMSMPRATAAPPLCTWRQQWGMMISPSFLLAEEIK
ncbi:uncharacterized protein Pyn_10720 [Prunus yedoensis var. nudiflora]|uniref:Uncharacterized protein n=1 Tax=Prunus yedoensis var. nudiflora TaxID=2094558 RepID=A0A314XS24_PRUYE|nr:uncharacterized protein Pyn_10720 [Prunus yedoensis var. nudiflora]